MAVNVLIFNTYTDWCT